MVLRTWSAWSYSWVDRVGRDRDEMTSLQIKAAYPKT